MYKKIKLTSNNNDVPQVLVESSMDDTITALCQKCTLFVGTTENIYKNVYMYDWHMMEVMADS